MFTVTSLVTAVLAITTVTTNVTPPVKATAAASPTTSKNGWKRWPAVIGTEIVISPVTLPAISRTETNEKHSISTSAAVTTGGCNRHLAARGQCHDVAGLPEDKHSHMKPKNVLVPRYPFNKRTVTITAHNHTLPTAKYATIFATSATATPALSPNKSGEAGEEGLASKLSVRPLSGQKFEAITVTKNNATGMDEQTAMTSVVKGPAIVETVETVFGMAKTMKSLTFAEPSMVHESVAVTTSEITIANVTMSEATTTGIPKSLTTTINKSKNTSKTRARFTRPTPSNSTTTSPGSSKSALTNTSKVATTTTEPTTGSAPATTVRIFKVTLTIPAPEPTVTSKEGEKHDTYNVITTTVGSRTKYITMTSTVSDKDLPNTQTTVSSTIEPTITSTSDDINHMKRDHVNKDNNIHVSSTYPAQNTTGNTTVRTRPTPNNVFVFTIVRHYINTTT